jgi:methyl-accepting chemotaxis protein
VFRMQGREATRLAAAAAAENLARERRQRAMEGFTSDFSSSVSGVLQTLSHSATKMKTASRTMIDTASSTRSQMVDVQKTSETSAGNLATVAAASEEMLSSIGEIRRQIDRAAEVTAQAVTATQRSSDLVDGLATSAQQIGDVVKLINEIAGQTNLLALNATIEAARAGEAGRGFAVVANEVKGLAAQTARATTDIAERIQRVQESTGAATGAIRDVTDVVGKVDEIARAIAGAMDQQSQATQEIVQNVQLASRSTHAAAEGVTQVFGAADTTTSSANDVLHAADEVAAQADDLHGEVQTFLTAMTRAGDRREFERHPCCVSASLRIGDTKSVPVVLLDISRSGAQIDRQVSAPIGGTFELQLEGTSKSVTVRVARKDDSNTGITFRQDEATTNIITSVLDKVMREVSGPRAA